MATEKSSQQASAVDLTSIRPMVDVLTQFLSLVLANMELPASTVDAAATHHARQQQVRTKAHSTASPPVIIGDQEYTVAQAAIRVKRNRMTVHKWIRAGEVRTRKDDRGRHLIMGKELSRKITKEAMAPSSNGATPTEQ